MTNGSSRLAWLSRLSQLSRVSVTAVLGLIAAPLMASALTLGSGDFVSDAVYDVAVPGVSISAIDFEPGSRGAAAMDAVAMEDVAYAAVPEPATGLLMSLGLAGLGLAGGRRS